MIIHRPCSCAHFSALIIILTHILVNPVHSSIALDLHLVSKAIQLYEKLLNIIKDTNFHSLRQLISELHEKALAAVELAQPPPRASWNDERNAFQGHDSSNLDWLAELDDENAGSPNDVFADSLPLGAAFGNDLAEDSPFGRFDLGFREELDTEESIR